ncbi:MAG TPA: hypothetical protein VK721_14105 [Solirubrobacteraceae bacterium]|jgi:hypothetical protein|nr:hypothetical protein [Solirubrobacteraceae bacterium]
MGAITGLAAIRNLSSGRQDGHGIAIKRRQHWQIAGALRARLVLIGCMAILTGAAATTGAAPAAASVQGNIEGIEFGFENRNGPETEYLWAAASNATLEELGAKRVTGVACRAVTDDVPPLTLLCKELVAPLVRSWINTGHGRADHGHWVAYYPHLKPHFQHGRF